MAIQTIYTQVDNAKLEPCKKGKPELPFKIPLLRNNYLGEYRTQVEKDKVLKNLGILGATGKYTYPSDVQLDSYKDIKTVNKRNTMGIIPNGLSIVLNNGEEIVFVVSSRNEVREYMISRLVKA